MILLEMVKSALNALKAHKLRTTLSVLGIVIGVAAVVAIIAMVNGATAQVTAQISALGMRTITINIFPQAISSAQSTRALTQELTDQFSEASAVSEVLPTSRSRANMIFEGESYDADVLGVTPEYSNLFEGFNPRQGRFIHPLDEDRKVVVLGAQVAEEYFGQNPVGENLTLNIWGDKTDFTVIGVMKERGQVGMTDLDDTIYIPISTAQTLSGSRQFTSYIAQAKNEKVVETAASQLKAVLQRTVTTSEEGSGSRRGPFGGNPYQVQLQKETIQSYEETVSTMTLILGGVAAISLLVGGVGIMNILLVSVTERTREIGIRMAIGARPADIRTQFLIESVLISFLGGLIGLALGWLAAWVGSILGEWPFTITVFPALLACGFSLLIGVTFGLYPAIRASKMDPVEALGFE